MLKMSLSTKTKPIHKTYISTKQAGGGTGGAGISYCSGVHKFILGLEWGLICSIYCVREYGQSRETGNIWYTRRRKKSKNTTQYVLDTTIHKTQDEDKQNKNTTQYVLDTTMCKQIQITYIRQQPSYKQLKVETNRTSFVCGNRHRHHNTELRTYRNKIGQHKKINGKMGNTDPTKNTRGELRCSRMVSGVCFL